MYNIRFIALADNVDTANSASLGMDMMPIMNIVNVNYGQTLFCYMPSIRFQGHFSYFSAVLSVSL